MRRLHIITAFDEAFKDMGSICERSIKLYASLHGFDYSTVRDMDLTRPPAWTKIKAINDALARREHEYVMWIDADACIVRGDVNVLDHVSPDKDLYLVRHWIRNASIPDMPGLLLFAERPNTGVMLVRNTEWSRALFQQISDMRQYDNHHWWEQAAFMDLAGYHYELTHRAKQNAFNDAIFSKLEWLPAEWNAIPTLVEGHPDAMRHKPIILHFAGMENEQRKKEMSAVEFAAVTLSAARDAALD